MKNSDQAEIFSSRLRALMSERRYKGVDLADKLGVRPATISGWRNGGYLPERDKRTELAEIFKVSEAELFSAASELQEPPAPYQADRPMRMPPTGSPDESKLFNRADIEAEVSYYLDRAEKAGALAVAALAIRKHLDPRDFDYLDNVNEPTETE